MRYKKPLPVPLVILLDVLGIGAMLGIYALFLFVLAPGGSKPAQSVVSGTTPDTAAAASPAPTESVADSIADPAASAAPEPTPAPAPGDFSATFPTGDPQQEGALGSYADENIRVVVKKMTTDDAVYFVADVWVRNTQQFKTAFARGKYGRGYYEMPSEMAINSNAVIALSGDCFGARTEGLVVRNGTLYRDSLSGDVCVLYSDGVMESYYESNFDLDAAVARGIYQSWSFGPKLIDNGQIPSSYNTTDTIIAHNPRSAIGYFEPGHYCLVAVDGRQSGYSKGLTLTELSQAMIDLGCKDAYNLDGGQSAMMIFQGQVVGQPYKGGREISDIIYFGGNDPQ